jgi:PAS domain S-box-containing protein
VNPADLAIAPAGLLIVDESGYILDANLTAACLLELPHAELLTRRFADLLPVGARVFHHTHLMPLLQMQGSVAEVQLDLRRGASTLPAMVGIRRALSAGVVRDHIAFMPATDRKKYEQELLRAREHAEVALKERQEALASLEKSRSVLGIVMRGVKLGVWSRHARSGHTWWSAELQILLGMEPGSFSGNDQAILERIHPDDGVVYLNALTAAASASHDWIVELRLRRADGSMMPVECRCRFTADPDGEPVTYGSFTDISDRLQSEESRLRQSAVAASQFEGVIVMDNGGRIVEINPAAERVLPGREGGVLGQPFVGLQMVTSPSKFDALALQRLEEGIHWQGELWFESGTAVAITEALIRPLHDHRGRYFGAACVLHDISERRRAEQELRRLNAQLLEADRHKDVFLATLAHELRNPLMPMRSGVDLLRLQAAGQPATARTVALLDRQVRVMGQLVNDLLDIARIRAGKLQMTMAPISLSQVIESAMEMSGPTIKAAGQTLHRQLDCDVTIQGDQLRLTQAVTNLLNNASKYTPEGGGIWLQLQVGVTEAKLSVSDNGIGIEPEQLATVFETYAQLEDGAERAQGGIGIGLGLVRGIVDLHHGSVTAHSAGRGHGSTFTMILPLLPLAQARENLIA